MFGGDAYLPKGDLSTTRRAATRGPHFCRLLDTVIPNSYGRYLAVRVPEIEAARMRYLLYGPRAEALDLLISRKGDGPTILSMFPWYLTAWTQRLYRETFEIPLSATGWALKARNAASAFLHSRAFRELFSGIPRLK